MGAEFLELDLGLEAVLGFHHHIHQFVPVGVPHLDAAQVAGTAFIVDDERHHIVTQDQLELLGVSLSQLGDTLLTIVTQKGLCCK